MKRLAIFLLILFLACGKKSVPEYAPDFTLPDLKGDKISLSDFRGKIVILEFFTTWCKSCRLMVADLNQLYNRYRDKNVIFLGISLDGNVDLIYDFAKKLNIAYPILIGNEDIVLKYGGISVLPHLVIVDPKGRIYKTHRGFMKKRKLEDDIISLIHLGP
ncbi:MAG TPA: TlpA family protein disulfide reductase [Candidatus Desulfofervidus auxilii]|uniref:TlpA family protein disulfide reductase n=1 Tax=Desulfofervidus auxilii TaxID=1621989 RepID=A0A7C0Y3X7_DESA2|nr:TlpA family protein disulfide reductase [Candidatus Desulfofervidus auxilii]